MSAPACFSPTPEAVEALPDLVRALKYANEVLMTAHDDGIHPVEWECARYAAMDQARAAIAKAEGRA